MASGRVLRRVLRLGPRYQPVVCAPSGPDMEVLSKMVEAGELRAVIDRTFPLDDVRCVCPHTPQRTTSIC